MRRRRKPLAVLAIALTLALVAAGGLLRRPAAPEAAVDAPPTPAAPVAAARPSAPAAPGPASAAPEPRPVATARKPAARHPAPRPRRAAPPQFRPSLKLLHSLASLAAVAAPAAQPPQPLPEPEAPSAGRAGRSYLVFVNQCDGHDGGSAEYRRCRAAEIRRLAFACGFYQREIRTVSYRRAADTEGWMNAYCHKLNAYKASVR